MKPTFGLMALTLAVCAVGSAQDDSGRLAVAGHGGSKPWMINVTSHNGPITVKAYSGKELMVEPCGGQRREEPRRNAPPQGMHRLNLGGRNVEVEEQDNVFTVRGSDSSQCINLSVPAQTGLKATAHNGAVTVEGIHGDIEVDSYNGHVVLNNISGTANVSSRNGTIEATLDRVESTKPTSFSSTNGKIDITLPADLKANLKLKAFQGDIWTDFDVMMSGARPSATTGNSSKGKYQITFDRTVMGSINGGGVEIALNTLNGAIYIHKKK